MKNEGKIQVAQIQAETDLKIADMKSDDAREIADVAHTVKNKQMYLQKALDQQDRRDEKAENMDSQAAKEAQEGSITPERKQQIQETIKNS